MGSLMNVAITVTRSVGQVAAQFAPVPWLCPAVDLLCGIIQLCQNVTTNKYSTRQLRDRCYALLLSLRDKEVIDKMVDVLDETKKTLFHIKNRMHHWTTLNRFEAFTKQKDILDEITACHGLISDCLAKFQILSHLEIHNWQTEFEINQRRDHNEIMEYLSEIQNSQTITNGVLANQSEMLRTIMTIMQNGLEASASGGDRSHNGLQNNLYQLQLKSGELLPDFNLKRGEVRRMGNFPVSGSSAMDIWEGVYLGGEKVAIKVIRAVHSDQKSLRRFLREVSIWGEIWRIDRGRRCLPFYGFSQNDGPYPYMVSPWQRNGTMMNYVKKNDREVDYRQMIRGIGEGLLVLHTMNPPVVHGDLKGANIVIDNSGHPLLADFGLSQIVEDITGIPFTQSRGVSDSYRWFAPEVCVGQGVLSISSDLYAYAMTVLELVTHQQPFANVKHTTEVVIRSSRGEHPRRPTDHRVLERGLDDKLWCILNVCWATDPTKRLTIQEVLKAL